MLIIILLIVGVQKAHAGGLLANHHPVLENYIAIGLEGNLAFRQEAFSFRQSLKKLDEARSYFFPSVGVNTRYSRADGGRMITIPVGDLVNPIHTSLNELLGENRLPANIPNERTPFLREKEHETKVRLVQQILNLKTVHNYRMHTHGRNSAQAELSIFRRRLVKEVKTAYFTFLKAGKVIGIYKGSIALLEENLRGTRRLFKADKVTKDAVLRARAELSRVRRKYHEALNQVDRSKSYFNFLLNRELDSAIEIDAGLRHLSGVTLPPVSLSLDECKSIAGERRNEIYRIRESVKLTEEAKNIARSEYFPKIYLVADYGLQGPEYRFSGDDDYWMVSGIVEWNLFNGFGDRARVQHAQLAKKKLETMLEEVNKKIALEVEQRYHDMTNTREMMTVAAAARSEAEESFRLMSRKYGAGMSSPLEYIDAHATKTTAQLEELITNIDYLICLAALEEAMALFDESVNENTVD